MWGEINNFVSDANNPVDLSSFMDQSRQKDCLSMYKIPNGINESREIVLPTMESRMLYAAELHKCTENMTNVIEEAELAIKYNLLMQKEMSPVNTPETPDIQSVIPKKTLYFCDKEYSDFTMGFGPNPPIINELTRRQIEQKCIATMLCHIGFLSTNNSVIELLTDIFESFMKKICKYLRSEQDSLLTEDHAGFSDIVERTLLNVGVGGVKGLCDYYGKRIIKYENTLKKRYSNVVTQYEKLISPINMQIESKLERMEEIDSQDVPEVHFTAMDGEEGYLQPFLESGFQMLNSLEEGQYVT